jgi:uncharacterized membrane protein YphA (DoxX/SURF4 family)
LLRAVVGVPAVVQGATSLGELANAAELTMTMALGAVAIISGASLVFGFLTPAAGALAGAALISIPLSLPSTTSNLVVDRMGAGLLAVVAVAIVLIGPGALSVDARLFGRREISFPHHDTKVQ